MIAKALGKTAIKWLLIACAFIALLSALNYGLGFVPFTPQWQGKRQAVENSRLRGEVSTLVREATGNAEIAAATDTFHTREIIIREGTAEAIAQARNAPDADAPLTDERASRLRAADFRLCDEFAGLCADADAPGSRPDAVPPAGPAG
jgi:hypothetical protein